MSSLTEIFKKVSMEMEIKEEKLKKEMSEIDLACLMGLSDTIVSYMQYGTLIFTNINTGVRCDSFDKCIRDGVKYIYIDGENPNRASKEGYLAKYFPEKDILLAVIYGLKRNCVNGIDTFSWEEERRLIISCDSYLFFSKEQNSNIYKPLVNPFAVSLCGQYLDFEQYDKILSMPILNLPCQSAEEISKFCKGVLWINDFSCISFMGQACYLNDVIDIVKENNFEMRCGVRELDMEGIQVDKMDIPENIVDGLSKGAFNVFNLLLYRYGIGEAATLYAGFSILKISMLQNCGGEYVLRKFHVHPCGAIDKETGRIPVKFVEFCRVHVTEIFLSGMDELCVPLVYFDRRGITDGAFKYAVKCLEEAENTTIEAISKMQYFYNLDNSGTICLPYLMAFYLPFEKLYNMLLSGSESKDEKVNKKVIDKMLERLKYLANHCNQDAKYCVEYCVGMIDDNQSELHKILGISKEILKMLAAGRCKFYHVEAIKDIFLTDKKSLEDMDEKTASVLVSFINKSRKITGEFNEYSKCLRVLLNLFGVQNISGYISLISNEYMPEKRIRQYYDYIKKLAFINGEIGGLTASFQWKVKYEDFERTNEAVSISYSTLNDKKNFSDKLENFKLLSKNWEQYEYRGTKFSVIYPKGPSELIEEGFKLNHCAKTFIDSVSSGNTIIMFIRRTENLHKPFFTLEIKNRCVRQCHGYNNCNVTNDDGLLDFIIKYCEEKNLAVVNFNEQFGPQF